MPFFSRITRGAVEVCDMTCGGRGTTHVHVVVVIVAVVHLPILVFGGGDGAGPGQDKSRGVEHMLYGGWGLMAEH